MSKGRLGPGGAALSVQPEMDGHLGPQVAVLSVQREQQVLQNREEDAAYSGDPPADYSGLGPGPSWPPWPQQADPPPVSPARHLGPGGTVQSVQCRQRELQKKKEEDAAFAGDPPADYSKLGPGGTVQSVQCRQRELQKKKEEDAAFAGDPPADYSKLGSGSWPPWLQQADPQQVSPANEEEEMYEEEVVPDPDPDDWFTPSGENTAHRSSRHLPYSADIQGSSSQHNINLAMFNALRSMELKFSSVTSELCSELRCLGEVVARHMPEVRHLADHKRADRAAGLSARGNGKQRGREKKNCKPCNKQKSKGCNGNEKKGGQAKMDLLGVTSSAAQVKGNGPPKYPKPRNDEKVENSGNRKGGGLAGPQLKIEKMCEEERQGFLLNLSSDQSTVSVLLATTLDGKGRHKGHQVDPKLVEGTSCLELGGNEDRSAGVAQDCLFDKSSLPDGTAGDGATATMTMTLTEPGPGDLTDTSTSDSGMTDRDSVTETVVQSLSDPLEESKVKMTFRGPADGTGGAAHHHEVAVEAERMVIEDVPANVQYDRKKQESLISKEMVVQMGLQNFGEPCLKELTSVLEAPPVTSTRRHKLFFKTGPFSVASVTVYEVDSIGLLPAALSVHAADALFPQWGRKAQQAKWGLTSGKIDVLFGVDAVHLHPRVESLCDGVKLLRSNLSGNYFLTGTSIAMTVDTLTGALMCNRSVRPTQPVVTHTEPAPPGADFLAPVTQSGGAGCGTVTTTVTSMESDPVVKAGTLASDSSLTEKESESEVAAHSLATAMSENVVKFPKCGPDLGSGRANFHHRVAMAAEKTVANGTPANVQQEAVTQVSLAKRESVTRLSLRNRDSPGHSTLAEALRAPPVTSKRRHSLHFMTGARYMTSLIVCEVEDIELPPVTCDEHAPVALLPQEERKGHQVNWGIVSGRVNTQLGVNVVHLHPSAAKLCDEMELPRSNISSNCLLAGFVTGSPDDPPAGPLSNCELLKPAQSVATSAAPTLQVAAPSAPAAQPSNKSKDVGAHSLLELVSCHSTTPSSGVDRIMPANIIQVKRARVVPVLRESTVIKEIVICHKAFKKKDDRNFYFTSVDKNSLDPRGVTEAMNLESLLKKLVQLSLIARLAELGIILIVAVSLARGCRVWALTIVWSTQNQLTTTSTRRTNKTAEVMTRKASKQTEDEADQPLPYLLKHLRNQEDPRRPLWDPASGILGKKRHDAPAEAEVIKPV